MATRTELAPVLGMPAIGALPNLRSNTMSRCLAMDMMQAYKGLRRRAGLDWRDALVGARGSQTIHFDRVKITIRLLW
jgi:hypothetical protein